MLARAMTRSLTLYSTLACQLCERAEALLRSMPELSHVALRVVDVADHAVLLERYGARIPVLASEVGELDWPFNADDVLELL